MTPIRVETLGVEPVSLAEMRGYLRLDPDDTGEDGLVASLVTAARGAVEAATRRILARARFRMVLTAWPADGVLPVALSPLVAMLHAGTVGADGVVTDLDPGLLSIGPDPWEAPCLRVDPAVPLLMRRAAVIEVAAGYGPDGPAAPGPLVQAIRMTVADWFENRGDAGATRGLPDMVSELIAPHRLMRI